ncbi:MAG: DNA primase [Methylococcales bacterium]|nr:DNA primase [Methylococcales bacterium]
MSGRIPREFIDDLLVRVDIVDLIDSHVPLKKAGSNYNARCPFHTEKTPSFSVNRKKQFYHCFGCGAGGNAISFLMEFSHLDFVEAIEDLAGFAGVDVPREAIEYQGQKHDYSSLYSVLEQAAIFYAEQLRKHPQGIKAIEYLKNRGLSGEIAKDYSLGYAPDEWGALASRFDNKLLLDAGMLSSKNDKVFDRFRGRLVFPIRDKRKRIIGFGGRVLDDSLPKYLNSPETAVFSKGKELYGLYELLEKVSKPKRILIVEGYMDVLALAQFGINYSVAALGTATSKTHLDLLFRFTSELVFCFDGDTAGEKAAWRAVKEAFPCLRDGRQIRVMLLPQGQDPDSLVRQEGVDSFERRILESKALSDFYFEKVCMELNLETVEGRSRLLTQAKPDIEKIPAGFFREMMFSRLKELSSSSALDVLENPATIISNNVGGSKEGLKVTPERTVIALLLQKPGMAEVIEGLEPNWDELSFPSKELLLDILSTIDRKQPENMAILLEAYRGTENEQMVNKLVNLEVMPQGNDEFNEDAEFKGALARVIEFGRRQYFDDLVKKRLKE